MNAHEIIGRACVDVEFRDQLFNRLPEVLASNGSLTEAERAGLTRITQASYKPRGGRARTGELAAADGTVPNTLSKALEEVGLLIAHMCPEPPCAWP
jgi:hypothetical protein